MHPRFDYPKVQKHLARFAEHKTTIVFNTLNLIDSVRDERFVVLSAYKLICHLPVPRIKVIKYNFSAVIHTVSPPAVLKRIDVGVQFLYVPKQPRSYPFRTNRKRIPGFSATAIVQGLPGEIAEVPAGVLER